MGEAGMGLLNHEMLKAVKRIWRKAPVALLYLHIRLPQEKADEAIRSWESEERGLFWKQRIGLNHVFFLNLGHGKRSIEETAEHSGKMLREKLAKAFIRDIGKGSGEEKGWFHLGLSIVAPEKGISAEALIFRSLLQMCEQRPLAGSPSHHEEAAAAKLESAARTEENDGRKIGQLASPIATVPDHTPVSEVSSLFDRDPSAQGVVVLRNEKPVGLLMKEKLHQLLAGQYGLPLYWNRPVGKIMDSHALIVDEAMPVEQVSQLAMSRSDYRLYDVVILTKDGGMHGVATIRSILECMTMLRTEAARSANPLTGLPGNEDIHSELARRIRAGKPFAMIYADLDYFKWFNDCFGFALGDELIRFVAELLRSVLRKDGGIAGSFLGHIGGDDFIAIMEPQMAEDVCRELIEIFDKEVVAFYGGALVTTVEDRHGTSIEQEGVSLSLSALVWDGQGTLTSEEMSRDAAKLKKKAKAVRGSAYVIENVSEMHRREERRRS